MNQQRNNESTIFVVLFVIIFILMSCSNAEPGTEAKDASHSASAGGKAGSGELKDAPDFTLDTMKGDPFTLSEHEGKVVVLNIWATWCAPCREEIPDFIKIQKKMRDEGVLFVGVSQDREGWEVVRPFADEYEINYPLVVDDGTVREKYGPFPGIPITFIINKKGKVAFVAPGLVNRRALQLTLDKMTGRE